MGRTWNSRQRALWTRERPSPLSSMRGEEVERERIREHAKKRRCNEITHHCPQEKRYTWAWPWPDHSKEGMTASTVIFLRQESLTQEEAWLGGKKSRGY